MVESQALLAMLRALDGAQVWALIDASGLERGRAGIDAESFEELECLFTGDLAVELADVAPYLVQVDVHRDDVAGALQALMDSECLVLLVGPGGRTLSFAELHRHLRKFNVVYAPDGQALFFRYFDARALPGVLEVLDPNQLAAFFGPVSRIIVPDAASGPITLSVLNGRLDRIAGVH